MPTVAQNTRPRPIQTIEFRCPRCGGDRWGTHLLSARGVCNGNACTFSWARSDDWRVFVDKASGRGFVSREHFERLVEVRPS